MKALDFSLEEIRDVLELLDTADTATTAGERSDARDRLAMYASLAVERCERLREQLAAASEFTDMLTRTTTRRSGGAEVRRR